nr:hypothetical protein [Tanacetum cinerariifolium]
VESEVESSYPKLVRNLSNVVTNDMFQPWRAQTTIINLCLTGKTYGFERPRAPVLQILWGVVTRTHIDYAERAWEKFTQSIHTFIEDKWNLTRNTSGKKKATLIVIPSIRFTKLIIHHLQRRHMFHLRPDSPLHLPNEEPVLGYLKFSAKFTKREVFEMPILGKKRTLKSVVESVAKDAPSKEPQVAAEDADLQKALEESMKSIYDVPRGPLPPVVIREPESGKYQPLLEVPGKGKAKVTKEQVSQDLLSLQKPKKKSPADQYIFQRCASTPTGSSGHDEPSYVELGQFESKESEKVLLGVDEGGQGEGHAGPDPGAQAKGQTGSDAGAQDEGQAGSNPDENSKGQVGPDPGNAGADVQSIPSLMVHAGSDREHMDLDVADVSPQPSMKQLDEGFTAMAYPKDKENLKLTLEEPVLLAELASSSGTLSSLQHLKTEVESMVSVTIQQDISLIPPMTSPIIDLTSRPESPKVHQQFKAIATETTTTTTTTTLPLPPSQQQSTAEAMMTKRIGELEHIMANLIQENKGLEERLDSHGSRLYTLEQLDIPHQVSQALYQALEKSMNRDHSQELAQDLAEARKKKKTSRESPNMPPGSPPHQPPPPPPSAGPSGASRAPGASGSSQVPPPPPPPSSTNQDNQSKGSAAPSSSKTVDMAPDEQAQSSDDEDIESAHIPKVNLRKDWWKPLEEERPATLKPAWSIPSSDVPIPMNN